MQCMASVPLGTQDSRSLAAVRSGYKTVIKKEKRETQ